VTTATSDSRPGRGVGGELDSDLYTVEGGNVRLKSDPTT
jgi:hypothetical protein